MRLALCVLVFAGAAQACPTSADLERGITFERADGSRQDHQRLETGEIVVGHVRATGAQAGWSLTAHGVHTLESTRSTERPNWQTGSEAIAPPQLNVQQRRDVIEGMFVTRFATYTQPEPIQSDISGCTFEVYRVGQYENGANLVNFRAFDWFPALGTGVMVGSRMGDVDEITASVTAIQW